MKYGRIQISAELLEWECFKTLGTIVRKEPSMEYAGAFDVLMESEYFDDIEEGSLIPRYCPVFGTDEKGETSLFTIGKVV